MNVLAAVPNPCEQEGNSRSRLNLPGTQANASKLEPPIVFVVDDEEPIQHGLFRLFTASNLRVETFGSAREYLNRPSYNGPSCLVLDVRLPDLDGLELQDALASRETQIIFMTGYGDIPMCAKAMKSGAIDFLTKPVDCDSLLLAVHRALKRSSEIHASRLERARAQSKLDTLTPREFEVMQKVIAGLLNKQIALQLGAAEKTIKIHRGRVMEKMDVVSVADLVRIAELAGVEPTP